MSPLYTKLGIDISEINHIRKLIVSKAKWYAEKNKTGNSEFFAGLLISPETDESGKRIILDKYICSSKKVLEEFLKKVAERKNCDILIYPNKIHYVPTDHRDLSKWAYDRDNIIELKIYHDIVVPQNLKSLLSKANHVKTDESSVRKIERVVLDIDKVEKDEDIEKLIDFFKPYAYKIYLSSSGKGLHVYLKVKRKEFMYNNNNRLKISLQKIIDGLDLKFNVNITDKSFKNFNHPVYLEEFRVLYKGGKSSKLVHSNKNALGYEKLLDKLIEEGFINRNKLNKLIKSKNKNLNKLESEVERRRNSKEKILKGAVISNDEIKKIINQEVDIGEVVGKNIYNYLSNLNENEVLVNAANYLMLTENIIRLTYKLNNYAGGEYRITSALLPLFSISYHAGVDPLFVYHVLKNHFERHPIFNRLVENIKDFEAVVDSMGRYYENFEIREEYGLDDILKFKFTTIAPFVVKIESTAFEITPKGKRRQKPFLVFTRKELEDYFGKIEKISTFRKKIRRIEQRYIKNKSENGVKLYFNKKAVKFLNRKGYDIPDSDVILVIVKPMGFVSAVKWYYYHYRSNVNWRNRKKFKIEYMALKFLMKAQRDILDYLINNNKVLRINPNLNFLSYEKLISSAAVVLRNKLRGKITSGVSLFFRLLSPRNVDIYNLEGIYKSDDVNEMIKHIQPLLEKDLSTFSIVVDHEEFLNYISPKISTYNIEDDIILDDPMPELAPHHIWELEEEEEFFHQEPDDDVF